MRPSALSCAQTRSSHRFGVGRTPWSAAGPLAGLFRTLESSDDLASLTAASGRRLVCCRPAGRHAAVLASAVPMVRKRRFCLARPTRRSARSRPFLRPIFALCTGHRATSQRESFLPSVLRPVRIACPAVPPLGAGDMDAGGDVGPADWRDTNSIPGRRPAGRTNLGREFQCGAADCLGVGVQSDPLRRAAPGRVLFAPARLARGGMAVLPGRIRRARSDRDVSLPRRAARVLCGPKAPGRNGIALHPGRPVCRASLPLHPKIDRLRLRARSGLPAAGHCENLFVLAAGAGKRRSGSKH